MQAIHLVKYDKGSSSCTDIWQLKIMNSLVKKQQKNEAGTDNTALLSMEILNSLITRFKIVMEGKLKKRKPMLSSFLAEKNLNFLQDRCVASIQELVHLVVFFDLPLNFISEPLHLDNINIIQFMFEIKNRFDTADLSADFMITLWNILKN